VWTYRGVLVVMHVDVQHVLCRILVEVGNRLSDVRSNELIWGDSSLSTPRTFREWKMDRPPTP
jgi:hypothetical protein